MSIGYACIVLGVTGTGLSRCFMKNATEDNLREIITNNLLAFDKMIDYNIKHHISLFRISSDLIPFGSSPANPYTWWEDYIEIFNHIGSKIKNNGIRVSMHPGQYTVLNSPDQNVVKKSIDDLIYHDRVLSVLGMGPTSKLVLHIGGVYGDKLKAMKEFINNYQQLPEAIKTRLIIENDDKNYTVQEVLKISEETGVPVVFDNLHHRINPSQVNLTEYEWIKKCGFTWSHKDGRQKIHYSQQKQGGLPGAHSDTIFMKDFKEFYNGLPSKDIDIMLEVKDKNLSALKCIHTVVNNSSAQRLEMEWARYKYYVLSKSARLYNEIRQLLKDKNAYVSEQFYEIIEEAIELPEDQGAEINAAQHVWGYIKDSTNAERNRYEKLMEAFRNSTGPIRPVKNHLFKCAQSREIKYLIDSLYFYI